MFFFLGICVLFKDKESEERDRLDARLGGARLYGGPIRLGLAAVKAALGSRPALELEVLLGLHGEAEVLGTTLTLDGERGHALVGLGAVGATLGLLPPVLFKDAGLGVGEEEGVLAVPTGEVHARGLGRLLGVAAVRAARRSVPAVLGEEELVLAREGEGTRAVDARELHVLRERRTLATRSTVAVTATRGLLGVRSLRCRVCTLLGRSCCGRVLVSELLLKLGNTLGCSVQELADVSGVITDREAVKSIVAVGASLEEGLLSDERHVERLVGRLG